MEAAVTLQQVVAAGENLSSDYWAGYTPATETEVARIEEHLNIVLPADFREFYLQVGWGHNPQSSGGAIYSPDDLICECSVPIYFVTGSRFVGDPWASLQEHEAFWISKGRNNPNPQR